ncbi:metal ABC transporter solute-binding protein, Zn/Mn family [Salisaeta longa]|uniref:metal ABC transporter solute-binding protein, Zn/Mn family n=1 Tax=Salisaeta longa TaxID=503170 RepID=UPI0003B33A1D|nr:zinc ABC transporter substrate-binding protein [Salisaeta longa]
MSFLRRWCTASALVLLLTGCAQPASEQGPADFSERKMQVVATTNIIGDLVRQIAGDRVELTTLMGPGVDPHLYKASEGDVQRMAQADVVLYNGLDLEGKMTEVFAQMQQRGLTTSAIADDAVPESLRIGSEEYVGNHDPHVWFDVELWARAARHVGAVLAAKDTARAAAYRARAAAYAQRLDSLDQYVTRQVQHIPSERRVLITSHDAFSYLGRAYDIEVRGLQGISTATEAGAADVQALAQFVAERRIPAIFVETSVSPRGIQAVQEAVAAKGFQVEVGGTLYGDALGNRGTPEGTYIGAVRHNIDTIVSGLLATPAPSAAAPHASTPTHL